MRGINSIRGYAYKELVPKDSVGNVIGGSFMGSQLEMKRPFTTTGAFLYLSIAAMLIIQKILF